MRKHPTFKYKEIDHLFQQLKNHTEAFIYDNANESNIFAGIDKFLAEVKNFFDFVDDKIERDPFISKEKLNNTNYVKISENFKTFLSSVISVGKLFGSYIKLYPTIKNKILNDDNLKEPIEEVCDEFFSKLKDEIERVHQIQIKTIIDLTEEKD